MSTDPGSQQPCTHCGDCARACPEALDPETLWFALVADDWSTARQANLDACSQCRLCVTACPSHIPLVDWFGWGQAELRRQAHAAVMRGRFRARNARLARLRDEAMAGRRSPRSATPGSPRARTISHAEVVAAIARGRAKKSCDRP